LVADANSRSVENRNGSSFTTGYQLLSYQAPAFPAHTLSKLAELL
jgi:hypothetical protein